MANVSIGLAENLTVLIAHMAQVERNHERASKGEDVKEAFEDKQAAKESIKNMKDEIERLKAEEVKAREDADWWNPFDDGEDDALAMDQIEVGIRIEETQKKVSAEQEKIEALQREVKDVLENFDTSRSIVDDMRKQIETASRSTTRI